MRPDGCRAGSPLLFARIEPWDTPYPFYSITAFLGGGLLGYRFRGSALMPSFLGAWLGQILALLMLPGQDHTWFLLGVVTTGIGSLLVLAGAALGAILGWSASWSRRFLPVQKRRNRR